MPNATIPNRREAAKLAHHEPDIQDPVLNAEPKKKQKKRRRSFCLFWCRTTDRILVEERRPQEARHSEKNDEGEVVTETYVEPKSFGLFGGGAQKSETPLQTIRRELQEEVGFRFKHFDYSVTVPGTRTTIFVKILEEEFKPNLSFESSGFRWVHDFVDVAPLHSVVAQNYSLLRRLVVASRKFSASASPMQIQEGQG